MTKDVELGELLKLYSFESVYMTADERAIADWIEEWLKKHKVVDYNRMSNTIYRLSNPDMPILSAHLDQVKTNGKAVKFYINDSERIIAFNDKWEQTSLGADDKNGVWLIMQMLKEYPEGLNFIISEGEETGCNGIKMLENAKILDNDINYSQFCIVLDRRGGKDMLKTGAGTTFCDTLAQDLCNFLHQDFEVTSGSLSDTCTISKYCESVNMSVAYDNPHTAKEVTDYKRLKEIRDELSSILNCFEHYSTPPSIYNKTKTTTSYYNRKQWDEYYGY